MTGKMTPGVVIAAPASGSGKSMIASGLMRAFSKRCRVQGFKIGPDYIDPMYHSAACGSPSVNLDPWMLNAAQNRASYAFHSGKADLAIVEGVMGLFDGTGGSPLAGSTAGMAQALGLPIVLVVDCGKLSGSAAALVHGFDSYCESIRVAGVICNRVGSARHEKLLREALTPLSIPLLGFVPKEPGLIVPERHLGLVTAVERAAETERFLETAAQIVSRYLDLDAIQRMAGCTAAPDLSSAEIHPAHRCETRLRLAVARDEAFCFYYADNLSLLAAAGVEIVLFSPIHDHQLPKEIQGVYLGGGYPELYAQALSENSAMRASLGRFAAADGLIFAECGGLVYLTESIRTEEGIFPLAGILPGACRMTGKLRMGYRSITAAAPNWLLPQGETIRSHEFHYSVWDRGQALTPLFHMRDASGADVGTDGVCLRRVVASYNHIHFGQNPQLVAGFVQGLAGK